MRWWPNAQATKGSIVIRSRYRSKSATLCVSKRRMPQVSITATTLASWTFLPTTCRSFTRCTSAPAVASVSLSSLALEWIRATFSTACASEGDIPFVPGRVKATRHSRKICGQMQISSPACVTLSSRSRANACHGESELIAYTKTFVSTNTASPGFAIEILAPESAVFRPARQRHRLQIQASGTSIFSPDLAPEKLGEVKNLTLPVFRNAFESLDNEFNRTHSSDYIRNRPRMTNAR